MARTQQELFEGGHKSDMSPMIDLVFLLLIFFMIASRMIDYKKDPNVIIPTATAAQVPKRVADRIILNIYEDGTIKDENATTVYSAGQIEALMSQARAQNPKIRLHLRADKRVTHRAVKEVIAASARGGVTNVIFSTYQVE